MKTTLEYSSRFIYTCMYICVHMYIYISTHKDFISLLT